VSTDVIDGRPAPGGQASWPDSTGAASITVEREVEVDGSVAARLAFLVVAAAGIQIAIALTHPVPWIVPDEIIYSEVAKSIAAGHLPAVRGVTQLGYGSVYPLLIAPAWALFSDATQAYAAARIIGACVMALSAIPAYLLARLFVPTRRALIVASFAVFLPSLLLSGMLLTEVALYPVSLLVFLAIAHALSRPTGRHQALALGAIALGVATKSVMIVMIPAFVVGVLLMAVLLRRAGADAREYLRRFRPTWLLLAGCLVAFVLLAVMAGGERRLLGYNAQVVDNLGFGAIPWWFLLHVAELDLLVAVAPFLAAALICAVAFRRTASKQERLYACLVLPTIFFLLIAIAGFSSDPHPHRLGYGWADPGARMHERNMFAVVPLVLIGFALWLERPSRLLRRWMWVAGIAAIALVALLPLSDLYPNADFQAMALVPWFPVSDAVPWPLGGILLATVAVVLLLRGRVRAVWVMLGTVFAVTSLCVTASFSNKTSDALDAGFGGSTAQLTWIDDAVGRHASVVALWWEPGTVEYAPPSPGHRIVWLGEFFNRSVGPVYSLGPAMPYSRLPLVRATRDAGGAIHDDTGRALRASYVLTCGLDLDGRPVARLPGTGAAVWKIEREPVHVTTVRPCDTGNAS
jgi:hypothetical protein